MSTENDRLQTGVLDVDSHRFTLGRGHEALRDAAGIHSSRQNVQTADPSKWVGTGRELDLLTT